jgi:RimJ/RimL family protein N-acetyltransferase
MPELSTWMSWCHAGYGLEDAAAWIARSSAAKETASEHNFLVLDAASRILGTCGLNQIRPENRLANLGYWIRTSATGSGVATEAVGRLAEYAFRETDLVRLEIVVAADNPGSRRVAEKSGAIFEGIAHDRIFIHGAHTDAAMYALLRSRRS